MPEPPNIPNDAPDHPPTRGQRPSDPKRQASIVNPQSDTDLLGASTPFDPAQWAMHGLLSVFFETDQADRTKKADALLARIIAKRDTGVSPVSPQATGPGLRHLAHTFFRQLRSHRWAATALVAAACMLIGFSVFWPVTRSSSALGDIREAGYLPPLLMLTLWPDLDDEAAIRQAEQAVAEARAELPRALAIHRPDNADSWIPWTKLYRNLWTLGEFDEALEQARQALAHAREHDREPARYTFHYVCLTDLGKYYLALGDYDNALIYYTESLRVARDYHDWYHRSPRAADSQPHAQACAAAVTVAPRHRTLSLLAAAQGDQETAWHQHRLAGDILLETLHKLSAFLGLTAASDTTMYDLCMALCAAPDPDPMSIASTTTHVRQHLLHEAMLLRLDRKPEAAAQRLAQARAICYFPFADDFRQDFNLPMEALRIAIARGDFPAALNYADQAAQNTVARPFPDHPPIGPLPRAQLRFLRGAALLGIDDDDPEALSLVESAIQAVRESANALPEARRRQLLDSLAEWMRLGQELRHRSLPTHNQNSVPLGRVHLEPGPYDAALRVGGIRPHTTLHERSKSCHTA